MSEMLQAGTQLERTLGRERVLAPAAGSFALHGALAGTIVFWGLLNGLFHRNTWGGTPGGGAIEVNITSALPLPAQKVNDNVLTTETPSQAPALPETKPQEQKLDLNAIPIPGKKEKPKPVAQNVPKTQPHQPQPRDDNRAHYGEQSGSVMPRSMAQGATGPTQIADSAFGSLYQWYVDGISRKLQQNQNPREVDPSTPLGTHSYLAFTVRHDGSPTDVQVIQSSGSATLDRACVRAVQRVDTFGQLPANYNHSTVLVSYDCQYQGVH
jgi:periplasmic protein TonB